MEKHQQRNISATKQGNLRMYMCPPTKLLQAGEAFDGSFGKSGPWGEKHDPIRRSELSILDDAIKHAV